MIFLTVKRGWRRCSAFPWWVELLGASLARPAYSLARTLTPY